MVWVGGGFGQEARLVPASEAELTQDEPVIRAEDTEDGA